MVTSLACPKYIIHNVKLLLMALQAIGYLHWFSRVRRKCSWQAKRDWPGFHLEIQKVVSDETDVCVFVKITEGLSTESIHHFVVQDGLEVEFNIYDDSQRMAKVTWIAKRFYYATFF